MARARRLLSLLVLGLCGLLMSRPARAHQGPPFPILVDQKVGPYIVQVWTDPDIGTGTFFVVVETPEGRELPARTRVRIGVQPVTRRLPEVVYEAESQPVHTGARYYAAVQFDRGEMWRTRVWIDGSAGGGELEATVEATPDGTIGPFGLVLYSLPFLGVGFLWGKAALRRRAFRRTATDT